MSGSHNYGFAAEGPCNMLAGKTLEDRHEYETKGQVSEASQADSAKSDSGTKPRPRSRLRRRRQRRRRVVESSDVQRFLRDQDRADSSSASSRSPSRETSTGHVSSRACASVSTYSGLRFNSNKEQGLEVSLPEPKRFKLDAKGHFTPSHASHERLNSETSLPWRRAAVMPVPDKDSVFVTVQEPFGEQKLLFSSGNGSASRQPKPDDDYDAANAAVSDRGHSLLYLTPLERLQRDCALSAGRARTEVRGGGVTSYQRYSASPRSVSPASNRNSVSEEQRRFMVVPSSGDSFSEEQRRLVVVPPPGRSGHSERNTKYSDGRRLYPEYENYRYDTQMLLTPESPAMSDFPDVTDTHPIVTPTRRRSENDKSSYGKNFIRREASGLEYPDGHASDRGRPLDGEKVAPVRQGAIWLHPTMFKDPSPMSGTGSKIMSEIEMANLRSTNQTPEYDVPYAGEVPSAQDRLLTGNHVRNGNGSPAFSPEFYQQYKQNVYEIGMHRPQPAGHGSGMVFRQRKRPCWCVLLVIVAVALMAAGISLGVLFGVVKKAEMTDSELAGQAGDASRNTSQPTVVVLKNSSVTTQASPTRTQAPPQTPTPSPDASPTSGKDFIPGSRWGVNVRRFKAFWHPGDSRVLEVLLSNGTKLLAAGHKANDGTLRGLYSLSLIDGQRRTTRVRFMGPHNLASIILPDGTIVNLDWSSNNQDVECKVFQIPPPVTSLGGAAARELNRPTSHLATLQLGVHSYLLRQVSRIINEAATDPGGVVEDEPMNPASRRLCTPRLPVKVTKCGGQYPYDGAFVQGDVTLQNGATLPMAALPWRRDDDDDECYKGVREAAPNFYIPLPGYIDQTTSREIAGRFLHSASRWWGKVCEVVGSVLEVDIERHEVCANMAVSAQTQLSHNSLYRVVYDSCTALLASLNTACRALDEVSLWAAGSTGFNHEGGMDTNRASSGTGGATGDASRQLPAQSILQHALANATSLQEPSTSRAQNVDVKTYAFCPSTQPLTSFEKSVLLTTPDGGGNVTTHEADMVHVNCMGHPEVTYFYLGHAAAADTVKHRLQVCAVCAFEKTISVHVMRDLMCCNDTCTREARCEETTSDLGEGLKESHTFGEQNSVYCHEFLTAADSPLPGLPGDCRGTCQSSLQVRFQVKDAETVGVGGRVYLDQVLACHEGYRSTCKSTFGH